MIEAALQTPLLLVACANPPPTLQMALLPSGEQI